tara:strand:+ start:30235 stop:30582 length:348 start_codon:yes stop_codon:yes gene_type:complete
MFLSHSGCPMSIYPLLMRPPIQSVCRRLLFRLCLALAVAPSLVSAHALKIHGPNIIGATLAPMLMAGFLPQQSGQAVVTSSPTGNDNKTMLSTPQDSKSLKVLVSLMASALASAA